MPSKDLQHPTLKMLYALNNLVKMREMRPQMSLGDFKHRQSSKTPLTEEQVSRRYKAYQSKQAKRVASFDASRAKFEKDYGEGLVADLLGERDGGSDYSRESHDISGLKARFVGFYNEETYRRLLIYTRLAYETERNGIPEEEAFKLALFFDSPGAALDYLTDFCKSKRIGMDAPIVHEGCQFSLPFSSVTELSDGEKAVFSSWQALAKRNKNFYNDAWRGMLPQVYELSCLIGYPYFCDIKAITSTDAALDESDRLSVLQDKIIVLKQIDGLLHAYYHIFGEEEVRMLSLQQSDFPESIRGEAAVGFSGLVENDSLKPFLFEKIRESVVSQIHGKHAKTLMPQAQLESELGHIRNGCELRYIGDRCTLSASDERGILSGRRVLFSLAADGSSTIYCWGRANHVVKTVSLPCFEDRSSEQLLRSTKEGKIPFTEDYDDLLEEIQSHVKAAAGLVPFEGYKSLSRRRGDLFEEEELAMSDLNARQSQIKVTLAQRHYFDSDYTPDAQLSVDKLKAFLEWYKLDVFGGEIYRDFIANRLTLADYETFRRLDRSRASRRIPPILIDGKTIGHLGYYWRRLDPANDQDAALACYLGKLTGCCQSLSGEVGQPCAIHGLTSPFGGFFVLCEGEAAKPSTTDPLIMQSWVWRGQGGELVFDSIECSSRLKKESIITMVQAFIDELCISLNDTAVSRIYVGATSGISSYFGSEANQFGLAAQKDWCSYSDARSQQLIYDYGNMFFNVSSKNPKIQSDIQRAFDKLSSDFQNERLGADGLLRISQFMCAFRRSGRNALLTRFYEQLRSINQPVLRSITQQVDAVNDILDAYSHRPGDLAILRKFIEEIGYIDQRGIKTNTALLVKICEIGDQGLLDLLVEKIGAADLLASIVRSSGPTTTPIHALMQGPERCLIFLNVFDVKHVRQLLLLQDGQGHTVLHEAVSHPDSFEQFLALYREASVAIFSTNKTVLDVAAAVGEVGIVELLLADEAITGPICSKALASAARYKQAETFHSLFEHIDKAYGQIDHGWGRVLVYVAQSGNMDCVTRTMLMQPLGDRQDKSVYERAAVKSGSLSVLKIFLSHPEVQPNKQAVVNKALAQAIIKNKPESVTYLLDQEGGAHRVKSPSWRDYGWGNQSNLERFIPIVCLASETAGAHDVLRVLLQRKDIKLTSTDKWGNSALDLSAGAVGCSAQLKLLLESGRSDVNHFSSDDYLIHKAACTPGCAEQLALLLAVDGINVNQQGNDSNTALHLAATRAGCQEQLRLLLADPRVDVNARNRKCETALHLAAGESDCIDRLRLLVNHDGIDMAAVDKQGNTALHHVTHPVWSNNFGLFGAREFFFGERTVLLMASNHINIHAVNKSGRVAFDNQRFRNASRRMNVSRLAIGEQGPADLIRYGLLHYFCAMAGDKVDVVEAILDIDGCNVDACDTHYNSALFQSVTANNPRVTELLLSRGASLHRRNGQGRDVLSHCAEEGVLINGDDSLLIVQHEASTLQFVKKLYVRSQRPETVFMQLFKGRGWPRSREAIERMDSLPQLIEKLCDGAGATGRAPYKTLVALDHVIQYGAHHNKTSPAAIVSRLTAYRSLVGRFFDRALGDHQQDQERP